MKFVFLLFAIGAVWAGVYFGSNYVLKLKQRPKDTDNG